MSIVTAFRAMGAAIAAVAALTSLVGCWDPVDEGSDHWSCRVLILVWGKPLPRGVRDVQVRLDMDKLQSSGEVIPNTGLRKYVTSDSAGECETRFSYDIKYKSGIYLEDIRVIAQCTHDGETVTDTTIGNMGFRTEKGGGILDIYLRLDVYDSTLARPSSAPERSGGN